MGFWFLGPSAKMKNSVVFCSFRCLWSHPWSFHDQGCGRGSDCVLSSRCYPVSAHAELQVFRLDPDRDLSPSAHAELLLYSLVNGCDVLVTVETVPMVEKYFHMEAS